MLLNKDIYKKRKELQEATSDIRDGSWQHIRCIENELDNLLNCEEVYWNQRAHVEWLKEGDCNTKFFHLQASERKARNRINGLVDANGVWQDEPNKLTQVVVQYLYELFQSN